MSAGHVMALVIGPLIAVFVVQAGFALWDMFKREK